MRSLASISLLAGKDVAAAGAGWLASAVGSSHGTTSRPYVKYSTTVQTRLTVTRKTGRMQGNS